MNEWKDCEIWEKNQAKRKKEKKKKERKKERKNAVRDVEREKPSSYMKERKRKER